MARRGAWWCPVPFPCRMSAPSTSVDSPRRRDEISRVNTASAFFRGSTSTSSTPWRGFRIAALARSRRTWSIPPGPSSRASASRSLKLPTTTPIDDSRALRPGRRSRVVLRTRTRHLAQEYRVLRRTHLADPHQLLERRLEEYEKIGWWEFIGAAERSEAYQKFFGIGCTRSLVAAQAKAASTKTIGDLGVQLLFNVSEPDISSDRVLNGPTNDVWIDPWLAYLRGRGVDYQLEHVCALDRDGRRRRPRRDRRARRCDLRAPGGLLRVGVADRGHGHHRRPTRLSAPIPGLANIFTAQPEHGVDERHPVLPRMSTYPIGRGHQIYIDSPWALTSVSQAQFWSRRRPQPLRRRKHPWSDLGRHLRLGHARV